MNFRTVAAAAGALVMTLVLGACSSDPNRLPPDNPFRPEQVSAREQRLQAAGLYRAAREKLDSGDFTGALGYYEQLRQRFPFTDYAVQGQLESIYAHYRGFQPDEALVQADRFLRDYPRNPHADYVYYLKGLVNFERDRSFSEVLGFDTTRRDTSNLRRAFDDFSLLIQRYPDSRYVADARARMIHVRNRIATHELTVVQYYMRRGAYVAAAKRAEQIVAQYPGAPATITALSMLKDAYDALGMSDQAADAGQLYRAYVVQAALAEDSDGDDDTAETPAEDSAPPSS